eukprot:6379578-Amphidinium_carterae.1
MLYGSSCFSAECKPSVGGILHCGHRDFCSALQHGTQDAFACFDSAPSHERQDWAPYDLKGSGQMPPFPRKGLLHDVYVDGGGLQQHHAKLITCTEQASGNAR